MWITYYFGIIASLKIVSGSINQPKNNSSSAVPDQKDPTVSDLASIFINWKGTAVKKLNIFTEDGNISLKMGEQLQNAKFENLFSIPDTIKYLYDTLHTRIKERAERRILKLILDSTITDCEYDVIVKCADISGTRKDQFEQFMNACKKFIILSIPKEIIEILRKCRGQTNDKKQADIIEEFEGLPDTFDRTPTEKLVIRGMIANKEKDKYSKIKVVLNKLLESLNADKLGENVRIGKVESQAVRDQWKLQLRKAKDEFFSKVGGKSTGPTTDRIWSVAPKTEKESAKVMEKVRKFWKNPADHERKLKKICAELSPALFKPLKFKAKAVDELKAVTFNVGNSKHTRIPMGKCGEKGDENVTFFEIDLVEIAAVGFPVGTDKSKEKDTTGPYVGTDDPKKSIMEPAQKSLPIFYYLVSVADPKGAGHKIVDSIIEKKKIHFSPDKMLKDTLESCAEYTSQAN